MARTQNVISTSRITFSASGQVGRHLERLVQFGLYGKTPAEVANTLVSKGIEQLIKDGILDLGDVEQKRLSNK